MSAPLRETPLRDAALPLLLGALLLTGTVRLAATSASESGADFYQFWVVSKVLSEKHVTPPEALDTPESARRLGALGATWANGPSGTPQQQRAAAWFRVLQPAGTPFFYTTMRAFAALPYAAAQRAFFWLSLSAWLLALLWLARRCGCTWPFALALAAFVTLAFEPMASEVRAANVNRLLFAALVLALAFSDHARRARTLTRTRILQLAAGCWMGLLIAYKPVLGPIVATAWVLKVARKRFGECILEALGMTVGLGLGIAVGALAMDGFGAWTAWAHGWEALIPRDAVSVDLGNYGPVALLERLLGADAPVRPTLFTAAALLVAVLFLRVARSHSAVPVPPPSPQAASRTYASLHQDALGLGFGFAVLCATSGLVWLHYQLLALPAIVATAPTSQRPTPVPMRLLWLVALLCIALEPLRPLLGTSATSFAALTVCGDAALAALTFASLWRRIPASA